MQRSTSDVASYRADHPAAAGEACATVFRRNSDFRALSRRYFFDCTRSPNENRVIDPAWHSRVAGAFFSGSARGVAGSLRDLEFHLAGNQDWAQRFATNLICGVAFYYFGGSARRDLRRTLSLFPAASRGLLIPGVHWYPYLHDQLRIALLG